MPEPLLVYNRRVGIIKVTDPAKPSNANPTFLPPILTFMLSRVAWEVIPSQENVGLAD